MNAVFPPGGRLLGGTNINTTTAPGVFDLPGTTSRDYNGTSSYTQLSRGDRSYVELRRRVTMAAWVRPSSTGAVRRIFFVGREGAASSTRISLYRDAGNRAAFGGRSDAEGFQGEAGGTATVADRWYLFAGDLDCVDNRVRVYLDGEIDGDSGVGGQAFTSDVLSTANDGQPGAGGSPGEIGASVANNQYWHGRIAAVYIWDRLLTIAEHRAIWRLGQKGITL